MTSLVIYFLLFFYFLQLINIAFVITNYFNFKKLYIQRVGKNEKFTKKKPLNGKVTLTLNLNSFKYK